MSIDQLVIGVDGSPGSLAAVQWGAELAGQCGAHVTAVYAQSPWLAMVFSIPPLDSDALRHEAEAELEGRWTEPLRQAGVKYDIRLGEDSPAQLLLDSARKLNADLLVVGRHGNAPWAPHVLGSVPRKLLQASGCPLVIVPPEATRQDAGRQGIVVGVDGSAVSIAALDWAVAFGAERHMELRAVTAVHVPELAQAPWLAKYELSTARKQALQELHTIVEERAGKPPIEIRSVVKLGHPNQVLTEEAARADLVVVGSRGRGATAAFLGGSVSQYVATRAPCPVVIHP